MQSKNYFIQINIQVYLLYYIAFKLTIYFIKFETHSILFTKLFYYNKLNLNFSFLNKIV